MDLNNYSEYLLWAGNKIRSLISNLTDEEFERKLEYFSFESIKEICFHIVLAQEYCLVIVNEIDSGVFKKKMEALHNSAKNNILKKWEASDKKLIAEFGINPESKITFPSNDGRKFTVKKYDFLLQYPTHTIFHRGQLIIALKKLGKEVVGTDYLYYLMEITDPEA